MASVDSNFFCLVNFFFDYYMHFMTQEDSFTIICGQNFGKMNFLDKTVVKLIIFNITSQSIVIISMRICAKK